MNDQSPACSLKEFLYCTALYGKWLRSKFFLTLYACFCLQNSSHWVSQVYIFLKEIPTEGSTPSELPHYNLLAGRLGIVFLYSLWDTKKSWGHRWQNHLTKTCKQWQKEYSIDNTMLWILCFLRNTNNCRKSAKKKLWKIISY